MSSQRSSSGLVVGIDFGTCRSSASVFIGGQPKEVPLGYFQEKDMPTAVFVKCKEEIHDGSRRMSTEILVGHEAESLRAADPLAFFEHFKRKVGSQERFLVRDQSFSPEDLVAAVIKHIRNAAQKEFNDDSAIRDAVITVPTTYVEGGDPWQAMERAGRMAGFESVTLVREPNAAAVYLDYLLTKANDHAANEGELTLVYDLGGGTFDPAIIQRLQRGYRILGDADGAGLESGGLRFDELIREHFRKAIPGSLEKAQAALSFGADSSKADVQNALGLLRNLERIKRTLSEKMEAEENDPFTNQTYKLTRAEFEELISPLLDQTMDCCRAHVSRSGVAWQDIKRILLVGGSSRIPLVRKKLDQLWRSAGAKTMQVCWGRLGLTQEYCEPGIAVSMGAGLFKVHGQTTAEDAAQREEEEAWRARLEQVRTAQQQAEEAQVKAADATRRQRAQAEALRVEAEQREAHVEALRTEARARQAEAESVRMDAQQKQAQAEALWKETQRQQELAEAERKRRRKHRFIVGASAVVLAVVAGVFVAEYVDEERKAAAAAAKRESDRILENEKTKLREQQEELEEEKKAAIAAAEDADKRKREADEAVAKAELKKQAEEEAEAARIAAMPRYRRIRLRNDCPTMSISVAVNFKGSDDDNSWATRGWFGVGPNQQIDTDISTKNEIAYVFAKNRESGMEWNGIGRAGAIDRPVDGISNWFLWRDQDLWMAPAWSPRVSMNRLRMTPAGDSTWSPLVFSCN